MRVGTKQRAIVVSDAFLADDGEWYLAIDVHSTVGKFEFAITPIQGARIAADLMAAWRRWETDMKAPGGPRRRDR